LIHIVFLGILSLFVMIWTIILTVFVLLIGIPVTLLVLFFLLPIRVGASGFYREAEYDVSGWARGWAGLCGVVFSYGEEGLLLRVVLGPWTVWQPKIEDGLGDADTARPEIKREPSPEPEQIVEPVLEPPPVVTQRETESEAEPEPEVQKPSWWTRLQTLRAQVSRYLDYAGDARPILWRFLKRFLQIFGFRRVNLDVELGVGDPALIGRLFGYVEAVKPMLGKRVRISLTPDFVHQRFAVEGAFEISIYLYRLIWAVLALAMRGGVLAAKVWWTERKVKRETSLAGV